MQGIIFDLDGTLIDSAPDMRTALNATLEGEGAAPLTLPETIGFIGNGLPTLVRRAREARGIAPEREAAMVAAMQSHYAAGATRQTRPYPGVVDCLEDLSARGFALGICTNKPISATRAILQDLDLQRFFTAVFGGDSLPVRKPDPAPLLATFKELGTTPFLYVGDSEVDQQTAAAAGIPFGLFTEGYRKTPVADLLEGLPGAFAFDRFSALPALVAARS